MIVVTVAAMTVTQYLALDVTQSLYEDSEREAAECATAEYVGQRQCEAVGFQAAAQLTESFQALGATQTVRRSRV